jgi:Fe-S-cluster containining protein
MIELVVKDDLIELKEFSDDSTLQDLVEGTEKIRLSEGLKTQHCYAFGMCCKEPIPVLGYDFDRLTKRLDVSEETLKEGYLELPEAPEPSERIRAIRSLRQEHDFSDREATLVYEFNTAEPVILKRSAQGSCIFLENNLCTIYEDRPFICKLYLCNMAENLSNLYETITTQGTWYTYSRLGWIAKEEIRHNPYLKAEGYGGVYLKSLRFDLKNALEKIFFYF